MYVICIYSKNMITIFATIVILEFKNLIPNSLFIAVR